MNATPPPAASPMVVAYAATSVAHPDHLLLYRTGEFYGVLLESAATVSRLPGIQLTRRKQKDDADIPMCGIPASAADGMIARMLAASHKVFLVLCPQADCLQSLHNLTLTPFAFRAPSFLLRDQETSQWRTGACLP